LGLERSWLISIFAFVLVSLIIEIFVPVARRMGLVDRPNHRKHHEGVVPLLGGLAIFCGILVLSLILLNPTLDFIFIFSATAILVFTGSLDDRLDIDFRIRLFIQFLPAFVLVIGTQYKITSLGNIFTFGDISIGWWSNLFTFLFIAALINAFNMIDGLDGLAGGLAFIGFSVLIAKIGEQMSNELWTLGILILGALAAYLVHNLGFIPKRLSKVFLGDAGSMMLGLIMALFLIKYSQKGSPFIKPITGLWLVSIPIIDMLATFIRRMAHGKSPFYADRTHIHHILLRLGFSPKGALILLLLAALLLSLVGLMLETYSNEAVSFICFCLFLILYTLLLLRSWRITRYLRKVLKL
jgi:UDP-GlcNAc:undecaprenyl-phosphate GlcNAc-1-phosphate transferase